MKRLFTIFLLFCLLALPISFSATATGSRTVLYLDYGDVKLGDGTVSGYDSQGQLVTETNPYGYTVTQKDSSKALNRSISVASGEQDIEIKDINISRLGENDYAICVLKTSKVRLVLTGENHLVPGTYCAGIEIGIIASLTIEGDGTLYTQSEIEAGIGGGSGRSNGTLTINSGTIYATGGLDGYGTGIGGGSAGGGGKITINGGCIVAVGGEYGAGIGGGMLGNGGTITVNGGTVTATGGAKASGIGGGFKGNGGTIVINGGSVKAVGGTSGDDIGNGYNCQTEFGGIHNSNGDSVSKLTVLLSGFDSVYQNGIENTPITAGHPDDENLYFYADANTNIATAYMSDGNVRFIGYGNGSFEELKPYINGDERFFGYLIASDKNNITVADGFSTEKENSRLIYNGSCVDEYKIVAKGDINLDGSIDGMDAVEAVCVESGMRVDALTAKLADANGDGTVDSSDVVLLESRGIVTVN